LLLLFAILPSMLALAFLADQQRQLATHRAEAEVLRLNRAAIAQERRVVDGTRQFLVGLAVLPQVQSGDAAACAQLFERLRRQDSSRGRLALADPQGRMLTAVPHADAAGGFGHESWFLRAVRSRSFVVAGYRRDSGDGETRLICAQPVIDAAGQVRSVLLATLDLDWLEQLASQLELPASSSIVVFDGEGRVLARYPEPARWVGSVFEGARGLRVRGERLVEVAGLDGMRRLFAFAPLRTSPTPEVIVGIGLAREAIEESVNRVFTQAMVALILLGGGVFLVAWRGMRYIVLHRIDALVEAIRRVHHGDLGARTGLPYGRGELSLLSRAFDEMASKLERQSGERAQAEQALRESEARKSAILEASLEGIITFDHDGRILQFNPAAERMFGHSAQAAYGRRMDELLIPEHLRERYREELVRYLETGEAALLGRHIELHALRADGAVFPVEMVITPIHFEFDLPMFTAYVRDITERKQHEQALLALSLVDELTGLCNRRGFLTFAGQQLKVAERHRRGIWLLFADVDDLKWINDRFGHAEGDRALVEVAGLLRETFRESDVVARIAGDEFAILALETSSYGAERLTLRLLEKLEERNRRGETRYRLSMSIGFARYDPDRPCSIEELLEQGDAMMYERKRMRRTTG
jgi:diguanylate cyclase (GGDEF)-like protein/PAS domain S-box-containing protein